MREFTKSLEFLELQSQFDKDILNIDHITHGHNIKRVSRDAKVPKGIFYEDGHINQLFHAYLLGYSNGKLTERLNS